ncbi:MAG: carboxylesterase/lipase family protein [Parasporobacterium sp.]|nr:carboxylesterase/lipase family protein [Parasporobacterium sp.]
MRKKSSVIAVILTAVLILTSVTALASPAKAAEPVTGVPATVTGGDVMGYRYDGVDTFFAIPYGTAERFQPAQAASWEGMYCANVMGEVCPQSAHDTAARDLFNSFPYNMILTESENNCLNLNVWTQGTGTEAARPVIVWLHGGGYSAGSSLMFNFYFGEAMARAYDVVFVSVNHRLNCLGYFDVSAYGDAYKYSANVGQMDIQLALQWVQDNIAAFGGDSSNVTIIGQSGGGGKVTTLMSTPSAKGLFQKAVALSGGSAQITRTTEQSQAEAAAVVEYLGLEGSDDEIVQALVDLPYEELFAACTAAGVSYGPVVDGDYIPTGTYEISADIPFIASNVLGEFSTNYAEVVPYSPNYDVHNMLAYMDDEAVAAQYVSKWGEDYGPQIMEAFAAAYPNHPMKDGLYLNDRYNGFGAFGMLDAMASYGGTCYNSLLAYDYAMYGGIVPIHTASSIPFWFNNVDDIPEFIAGDEEGAYAMGTAVSGALAAFAYTGNPSTEDLEWEAYTPENGATMVFDGANSEMKYNFFDKEIFDLISEAPSSSGESAAEDAEAAEEAEAEGESEEGESEEGESAEGESADSEGDSSDVALVEIPDEYTQVKVFNGTYGFGDAEITAATNDDFSRFFFTFVTFGEAQAVEGTVDDGIINVEYDLTGFMGMDAQWIWDDAVASENPWTAR